ncbi:MAG: glycosyltransferase family 2 protein, partial [Planctomycetaceae bacterium]|nr:glycosyltransferase family 2 protein [Planctomycetaceae bacterium]
MSVPISILFATAQRPQLVKRTLTSLLSVEQPSHFQGIWVVENGTRTGVENIVEELASSLPVHYLFSPEPSKPAAMNLGFSHLPDSLVYLTDDDVRF